MAIYNGRILMRKGNEADFDASKLMSGEWAVSLDAGIVRICLEAGKVIRMATYEAFEEDMKQIEAILLECQSIEEAVRRINTEVNNKLNACSEYVQQAKGYSEQAKQYRDEALQFRNEAEQFAPEGYVELKEQVNENTFKIDTVIEKADLGIKETASGEEIHLIDSAEGKAVEFALFGKARQDGEPTPENPQPIEVSGESYNLLENTATSQIYNGVEFVVNEDKSVTVNGTASAEAIFQIPFTSQYTGMVKSSGVNDESVHTYVWNVDLNQRVYADETKTSLQTLNQDINNKEVYFYIEKGKQYRINIRVFSGYSASGTVYPMIRKATETRDRYMPFGVGSVEVKSVGKNLASNKYINLYANNDTKKFSTSDITPIQSSLIRVKPNTTYLLCRKGGWAHSTIGYSDKKPVLGESCISTRYIGASEKVTVTTPNNAKYMLWYHSTSETATEIFCYETTETNAEYEPYKESKAIINGEFAGIKVSSNGNYTDQNGQQWICDEVVKYADGSGAYVQRVKKKLLSEATEITQETVNNITRFNVKNTLNGMTTKATWLMCNIFTNDISPASGGSVDNSICGFNGGATAYVICKSYTDIASFTQMLIDTNAYVIYALAEPIHTPLTAEELAEISTFYPVTNISNDFDCGMKVKYNCDSKNYIDNKIALLTTAMVNSI